MKKLFQFLFAIIVVLLVVGLMASVGGVIALFNPPEAKVDKASILALDLDGIIMDNTEFLEQLRKHRKDKRIKGVLVRISSPGGVVGPSQELYDELKRTREEFKKPVVAYCASVAASGAYYAAVGADKIVTTPGCLIGSIGAIMEFVNLEKLYDWAKIQRYAITTGKFKNAGAEYKAMAPEARELFQEMLNDVLEQFKAAIVDGRKMEAEKVAKYADGRVFTGAQAVKLGFADEVGSWDDARKMLGQMTGLGDDPEVFKGGKRRTFLEMLEEASESRMGGWIKKLVRTDLSGQPLFLLPGAYQH
ncbi:MAG: signal peptide peptidase SppA [Bdellovibrionales bacterium]